MASGKWVSMVAAIKFVGATPATNTQYPASTFAITRNSAGNYKLDLASDFQTAWGSPFLIHVTIEHSAVMHWRVQNVSASRIDVVVTAADGTTETDPGAVHLSIHHFNGS